jgi:NAD(P)-dependent dehydrogenase (short-subunit alcohol dehydrogenase family)
VNAVVSQLFDLSERVAIVTGATKGLGRSMAEGLAGAGASIVVVSRDQDACSRVADEIIASTGQPALGVGCGTGSAGSTSWSTTPGSILRPRR